MIARRLTLATLTLLCVLVLALAAGAASAGAVTQFGSEGSNPGEFRYPLGVAVDQASGDDVLVADRLGNRVDKFDGAGDFLSSWGSAGVGAGEFAKEEAASGIAVDNDPLSPSYGDVYVVDFGNFRVEKFGPSGEFLLMFGGGVNEKTGGDVCVAGEACTKGTSGTAGGQFEWSYEGSYIAVGPGGRVYVGDKARVQVFESSGAWRESVSLADLSATGKVTALAVDPSGDMFVKDSEAAGVRELEPNGSEEATQFDAGSTTVQALTLDGSGDLFVGDSSGGFHLLEYDSTGKELESFGSKTLLQAYGMALAETSGELYVSGYREIQGEFGLKPDPKVWIFPLPTPGPLVEPGSVSATPELRGHAMLDATVNPEGNETTYHYEYVDDAHFQASGYTSALSTLAVSIGSSFEDQDASASLTSLVPGVTYDYRIVASNSKGTVVGPDQSFEATPSALVDGPWTTNVASTSATFAASINPLGASTEYRLEYGTSTSYGHTFSGSVGEGMGYVPISFHVQGLEAHAAYHYRLVTVNEVGTIEGTDRTFTTQQASGEFMLPDGRVWELVSPPDKKGAVIEPFNVVNDVIQAADDGSGITYPTEGPAVGENPESRSVESTVLSQRGPGGWRSTDIDIPRRNVNEGESTFSLDVGGLGEYGLFSENLSSAVAEPTGTATPPLSPEATERTLYVRDNANGSFLPLVTPANVPSGTKFGGEASIVNSGNLFQRFVTATPDLSHVVFESPLALTPGAAIVLGCLGSSVCGFQNLYEWGGGRLQLVNVLPNGKATTQEAGDFLNANVAGEGAYETGLADRPVSVDGRWVVWTWGSPYGIESTSYSGLYVRDMVAEKTVKVGGPHALYQAMSSDGSRIFFLENGDLYEFDTATGGQSDLTTDHGGEANAGVQESVSDVSEDGSYVYFVATGVLARGGVSGADNLYLMQDSGSEWTTSYIATLSHEDENSWYEKEGVGKAPVLAGVSSRVSPNGRYLAFMSNRSLTGYDNLDANSGQPDEEVYLYDAVADRLVCASCNPTGARPVGVLDSNTSRLLVDNQEFWGKQQRSHWLAGSIPGWTYRNNGQALYQPRYLSDSGRLFFNSADALVPQDTNGREDVYEYESPANSETAGSDNCTTASPTFNARSGGCVNLISSGTSSSESVFYDASESGDDVFFITTSRLTAADYDNTYDVYDAHACSASVPCAVAPVSPPPCTSGDSCKAAPSPQPEIFGPAPSATFSGTGNVVEEAKKSVVKPKTKPKHKPKSKKHAKHKKRKTKKSRTRGASRKGGK